MLRSIRKLVLGLTIAGAALVLLTSQGATTRTAAADSYGGTVAPGQTITVNFSGFKANSTVTFTFASDPIYQLGTAVADSTGAVTAQVTIPLAATNGNHHIIATGVDPNGNPYSQSELVFVQAVVTTKAPGLAFTGMDVELLVALAALAILVGGSLVRSGWRRTGVTPDPERESIDS